MKKTYHILFFLLMLLISNRTFATNPGGLIASLSGKVTDMKTNEPIPGVYVYMPELRIGAISDKDGFYKIENLPKTKILVQLVF